MLISKLIGGLNTGGPQKTVSTILFNFFLTVLIVQIQSASTQGNTNQTPAWNETQTDLLKRTLLLNYDKFARPVQHTNQTKVKFNVEFLHFELDETKSLLTVYGWCRFVWLDGKLKWNVSDYGGLKRLHLADHEVWQPDIVLYNSASGSNVDHYGNTHLLVESDGSVLWVPPCQFFVFCQLDLSKWPFDRQHCFLKFGSWTYDGTQISMELYGNASTYQQMYILNAEWQVEKITRELHSVYYDCCPEPYFDVTYNVTLVRNSPTYRAIVITPAFVIIFLILSVFWLPPQATERIILNGCIAIIICIYLIYFSYKLPALSHNTPLIVFFYSNSLYLVTFSMIISVIVIKLTKAKHTQILPWYIKSPLTGWLGKILCLKNYSNPKLSHRDNAEELRDHAAALFDEQHTNDDHQIISNTNTNTKINDTQHDWILFAIAIDRICFIIYTFIFCIISIAYAI